MSPVGLGTKNNCAGASKKQFTSQPDEKGGEEINVQKE
jgi:hypothetical protein